MGLNIGGIEISDPFKSGVSWDTVGLGDANKWISKNPIESIAIAIAIYYTAGYAATWLAEAEAAGTIAAGEAAAGNAAIASSGASGGGAAAMTGAGYGAADIAAVESVGVMAGGAGEIAATGGIAGAGNLTGAAGTAGVTGYAGAGTTTGGTGLAWNLPGSNASWLSQNAGAVAMGTGQVLSSIASWDAANRGNKQQQQAFDMEMAYKEEQDEFENLYKTVMAENTRREREYSMASRWQEGAIGKAALYGAPGQPISQKMPQYPGMKELPTSPTGFSDRYRR